MNIPDLAALVKRVGTTVASRTTGLPRATIYGLVTGYARKGRARKSTGLPTRGAGARPEVKAALQARVAWVKLYAHIVTVSEPDSFGGVVATAHPPIGDVVYGDALDLPKDEQFAAMHFRQLPPATNKAVAAKLDNYFANKQASLEQLENEPQVVRGPRGVRHGHLIDVTEAYGSPLGGGVIVAYAWQFFFEGAAGPAPSVLSLWLRPSPALRRLQNGIMGRGRVDAAYSWYEANKPKRGPVA